MENAERVLILGSAPDVVRIRSWHRAGIDRIVAINNAWQVRPDWDDMIHADDFPPERRPFRPGARQVLRTHLDYVPAVNSYGGFVFCGGTMAFTAGYWALRAFSPRLIAFLGCDMTYPASGPTHFYGTGTADPIRPDPTLRSLEAKSARLALLAAEQGCAVVNLSENDQSRLVFPRFDLADLAGWTADAETPPSAETRSGIADVRAQEERLGYAVPSGKYWKELDRFDQRALNRIDRLWLSTLPRLHIAA